MNKTTYTYTTRESYNAICDYCGRIIATDCQNIDEVVRKAANGTSFNGDGNYKCYVCNNYKEDKI